MALLSFYLTLAAEILAAACVVFSILVPKRRIWPPPHQYSWQAYLMWLLFIISGGGAILVGIFDWGSTPLSPWLRFLVGLPLWLGGQGLGVWAMVALGRATTFGDKGGLVRRGPYRFSRNPQYVGFIFGLIGWGLLAGSTLAIVASLAGATGLFLAPFAEEPWLAERLGAEYQAYRRDVPRFLSLRRR